MWSRIGWLCLLAGFLPHAGAAQSGSAEKDSLKSYELAEIVVGGVEEEQVSPLTLQKVTLAGLVREDAATVGQVARLIPAAHIQTNSRGETLVYLRSAGERQIALFFDGALLNVPWDNRVDLSLVPANVLGGISVAKGVTSVLYGTNVIGGAINLTSRTLGRNGTLTEASGLLGSGNSRQFMATHLRRNGRFSYSGSLGYAATDGLQLPADAPVPFSQPDDGLRTNTDQTLFNLFSQGSYRFAEDGEVGVSLIHIDGEKGVAPESHLDPAVERVRYWRYPDWKTTMVILNGVLPLGRPEQYLRGAVWGSRFAQAIDQYASVSYDERVDRQQDEDYTFGTRLTLRQPLSVGEVNVGLNFLTSQHNQVDASVEEGGRLVEEPEQQYRTHIYSFGAEYDVLVGEAWDFLVGGSLDGLATPETGDKPARDPQQALGVSGGVSYNLHPDWALRLSAGRRVRFPTMRELFGEALNRFLVNPDLKPETSFLSEFGVVYRRSELAGEATAFFNRTFDAIDQVNVTVDGNRLRQRINLEGSRVYGVEVVGRARPLRYWTLEGHITGMVARGFEGDETRRLVEKPAWLSTFTLVHNAPWGLSVLLQSVYTGRAYGLNQENEREKLPIALQLNARTAYRFFFPDINFFGEAFVRVDNLTDVLTMPQLGLPGVGRSVKAGLSLTM